MSVAKVCEVCGKGFEVINSRADKAKTCSKECKYSASAGTYKESRIECECQVCGTKFGLPPSRVLRGGGKFCSRDCTLIGAAGAERKKRVDDGDSAGMLGGYCLEHQRKHPFAHRGRIFQHRLVMEHWMREEEPNHPFMVTVDGQKYLNPDISVHHKNELKTDNAKSNLVACTRAAHIAIHANKAVSDAEVWPRSEATLLPGQKLDARDQSRVECICEKCGGKFSRRLSSLSRGAGRFCSIQCRGGTTKAECLSCKKQFVVGLSVADRGHGKFCSRQCYHKHQRHSS